MQKPCNFCYTNLSLFTFVVHARKWPTVSLDDEGSLLKNGFVVVYYIIFMLIIEGQKLARKICCNPTSKFSVSLLDAFMFAFWDKAWERSHQFKRRMIFQYIMNHFMIIFNVVLSKIASSKIDHQIICFSRHTKTLIY